MNRFLDTLRKDLYDEWSEDIHNPHFKRHAMVLGMSLDEYREFLSQFRIMDRKAQNAWIYTIARMYQHHESVQAIVLSGSSTIQSPKLPHTHVRKS